MIAYKKELGVDELRMPPTQWKIASHNASENGTTLLTSVIGEKRFPFPKSLYAVRDTLRFFVADKPNALIVDFFAGSGTTLHAVNLLNAEDGGSRRFILAELDGYADTVTAERVRRVIHGYGDGKNVVPGIDSGFSYYELGPALFRGDGMLSPGVTRADLARYVWATETRAPYEDLTDEHPYLLGEHAQAVYYLTWEPGEETTLTYDLLRGLPRKGSPTVIFADRCAIAPERLDEMGVVFRRVPDQIARI